MMAFPWLRDGGDTREFCRALAKSTACCESHPQHALARRQMKGFGGTLSVELKAD